MLISSEIKGSRDLYICFGSLRGQPRRGPSWVLATKQLSIPGNIYLFQVNNRSLRKRCGICSKSTIKIHQNDVNDVYLVFLLLILNIFHTFFMCFYCSLWTSKYVNISNISNIACSQWRRFGVFNVIFEHIPHLFLVFLLLTLNK